MSLTIGPAFTIPGYTTAAALDDDVEGEATVYDADAVVGHPAFWSHYLAGPLGADRESGAAFDVTAADYQEMSALLNDPEHWPVVSVRLDRDAWLRIVYRNVEDDEALDFVQARPGQPIRIFTLDEDAGSSTMTWAELLVVADLPDDRLTWGQRLVLLLPMLDPQDLPADAGEVLDRALEAIGAANRAAVVAALLDVLGWRNH
ncbi:hypothetical protein AB0C15_30285 [Micromonospora sp. NPDC048835]|uniref:hypothetical protein n=1 Tax=Micromonospora sp. NPDC048835 TaxID=3155147 RepID=UPI0033FE1724